MKKSNPKYLSRPQSASQNHSISKESHARNPLGIPQPVRQEPLPVYNSPRKQNADGKREVDFGHMFKMRHQTKAFEQAV
jgi:hypothetical protein